MMARIRSGRRDRSRPLEALIAASILALTGCDAADREPEVLEDDTAAEVRPGDPGDPTGGAVVSEPDRPGTPRAAGTDTVEVTLVDFGIRMPDRIPPGPVTFRIVNEGGLLHGFEVEGRGEEWAVEKIEPGATANLQAELENGTWEVYCPVGDHADTRGMETTLEVGGTS